MPEESTPRRPRWLRRIVILALVIGIPLLLISLANRKPKLEPGTVLVVNLEGAIPDTSPADPVHRIQQLLGDDDGPTSLHDLRRALRKAKGDPRIVGVLLELHPISAGWGAIDEARGLIAEVRAAGKPVHALLSGDFVEEKEYSLAAAAGRIVIAPEGGLLLNGLVAEVTFLRGLLDNLKVEPEVLMFKEYKSAGEQLVNRSMSPAMREALTAIISEIYGRFITDVARERKIEPEKLRQMMDRGLLTSKEGLQAGLCDALGYRDEVEESLSPKKEGGKDRRASVARYLKALPDAPKSGEVALIYAIGPIIAGSSSQGMPGGEIIEGPKLAHAIHAAAEDDGIKAIVMRVDSPGGSAVGSDVVWREIQRAQKKKPVVVSMGSVAGSGGYWISMGADAIVAQPSTITGSIGVVFTHLNVLPLMKWVGPTIDTIKMGENADLLSPYKLWTPEQKGRITAWMQQVYDDFVSRAAKGRKLTEAELEPMAHGRIWSGTQAKQRKLIDEVGGLDVALRIAREKAKLPANPDAEPVVFPRQKGLLATLQHATRVAAEGPPAPDAVLKALRAELLETQRPVLLMPSITIR